MLVKKKILKNKKNKIEDNISDNLLVRELSKDELCYALFLNDEYAVVIKSENIFLKKEKVYRTPKVNFRTLSLNEKKELIKQLDERTISIISK